MDKSIIINENNSLREALIELSTIGDMYTSYIDPDVETLKNFIDYVMTHTRIVGLHLRALTDEERNDIKCNGKGDDIK